MRTGTICTQIGRNHFSFSPVAVGGMFLWICTYVQIQYIHCTYTECVPMISGKRE
jgi:hypothetical protein